MARRGASPVATCDEELSICIAEVNISARMVPEQKLRIVRALKARGDVVAMTGDAVNDAPALKAADIGIAMGARGTDVAREAAVVVLTDDDSSSIVGAVRQGRRADDNLRKAIAYIVAVHVPIAGMSLIPVVADKTWPLVLLPMHIALLELITDPACSVVFEAESEEPNLMERPPRAPQELLLTGRMVASACCRALPCWRPFSRSTGGPCSLGTQKRRCGSLPSSRSSSAISASSS